jgi:hypothetical protein
MTDWTYYAGSRAPRDVMLEAHERRRLDLDRRGLVAAGHPKVG